MYKLETHSHTHEVSPCGVLSAVELVRLYKEAGYFGIIVTDHYRKDIYENAPGSGEEKIEHYFSGFESAKKEGDKLGLSVMCGMEIALTKSPNDYLVLPEK